MGNVERREYKAAALLDLYPLAVREVYGYLVSRCGDPDLAEELTAESLTTAVAAIHRNTVETISIGWLIVVARRRLVDYWRMQEREERHLRTVANDSETEDPWDDRLDIAAARA